MSTTQAQEESRATPAAPQTGPVPARPDPDHAREVKNKLSIDGHINEASRAIMQSREPDATHCVLVNLAHTAVDAAFAANPTSQAAENEDAALTERQIQQGWEATFSTSNPFCPCDLKSFTKAARWAEHAIRAVRKGKA